MTPAEMAALADKVAAARREHRVMDFMPGATDAMKSIALAGGLCRELHAEL